MSTILTSFSRRPQYGTYVGGSANLQHYPAFIERLNLDFRQHVAAIGRRVNTLCKHEAGLRQQLAMFQAYHNFCLPHASLRLLLPETDDIRRWQPRTPAMAAGLTERVWSMRAILKYRVPPWPQTQMA
jgi:hypothetical protein